MRHTQLHRLRNLLQKVTRSDQRAARPYVSSGCAALDRLLPGGGLRAGSLVEWLGEGQGSGTSLLPLASARTVQSKQGVVVIVDRGGNFYPPAAAAWGLDLRDTFVLRPTNQADELWAIDQSLRSADVAAVVAWPAQLTSHTFRRWQLAAEASDTLGLLVRPASAAREPTWAAVRLFVSPQPTQPRAASGWRLKVKLLRARGLFAEGEIELQIDEQTGEIDEARVGNLATELAGAALGKQTA